MAVLMTTELQILLHVDKDLLVSFVERDPAVKCSLDSSVNDCSSRALVLYVVDCITKSRFEDIFKNEVVYDILKPTSSTEEWSTNTLQSLKNYLDHSATTEDLKYRELVVLFVGVAALQFFVQLNWVGPVKEVNISSILPCIPDDETNEPFLNLLSLCNEPVYTLTKCPQLLTLAKIILHDLNIKTSTSSWWKLRYFYIHQAILSDTNSKIYSKALELITEAVDSNPYNNDEITMQLHLEAAHLLLNFHDVTKSKQHIKLVQENSGLTVKLTGALGKRTQFQEIAYSQLFLKTEREKDASASLYFGDETNIPKDLQLQDETLLNNVKFTDPEHTVSKTLRPEDQAIVLMLSLLHQKQTAHDELLTEEMNAYANCLLSQPSNFCIQFCALVLRCKMEKHKPKKIERSMMQLQSLTDETRKEVENPSSRLQLFYCTPMPATWTVEKELASVLLSLGSVKSALEIFLRLQMWEECVDCYKHLQRNDKALEIIEKELEKNETPLLLCLKGDVTNDPSWYEKAWELSGHHSARAKRSMGYYHFLKKEYKECIPHFLESVEINSLEQRVWFFIGHAATQIEDYELAARCYRSLINLNSESFEAWNNLSNAYIRLNDKVRAWRALQEAIKCNYEVWKIWENYLLVCVDVGAFEDAINAWHRLIEIKGKHTDSEVVEILSRAVIEDLKDIHNQPASNLLEKALKLLGHITSTDTSCSVTWACYAKLLEHKANTTGNTELLDRVIQNRQKSLNIMKNEIQKCKSQASVSQYKELMDIACQLADTHVKRHETSNDEAKQQLHSAKLMLRNVISTVNPAVAQFSESDASQIINPLIGELERRLDHILTIIDKSNS